ncbi:MAG: hypothetical protein ACYTF7_06550 [Planctomycetota bacterium]|jgi:hypothetical protein
MKRFMGVSCATLAGAGVSLCAEGQVTLNFEDMAPDPPGAPYTYNLGDVFVTGGATLTVDTFYWFPSGSPAPSGPTTGVEADPTFIPTTSVNYAGQAGNALALNNMSVDISVSSVATIGFYFGEYGGNVNMTINGSLFNADDFSTLPATLGGASIAYTPFGATPGGTGGYFGRVDITGTITQFSVGGQELWVDDVRWFVPTPGAASLLGLGGLVAARRRR